MACTVCHRPGPQCCVAGLEAGPPPRSVLWPAFHDQVHRGYSPLRRWLRQQRAAEHEATDYDGQKEKWTKPVSSEDAWQEIHTQEMENLRRCLQGPVLTMQAVLGEAVMSTEPRHSPGPWHWEMMRDGQWWLLSPGFVPDGGGRYVLRADPNEGALPADARLIAAAPALLDALRRRSMQGGCADCIELSEMCSACAADKRLIREIDGP